MSFLPPKKNEVDHLALGGFTKPDDTKKQKNSKVASNELKKEYVGVEGPPTDSIPHSLVRNTFDLQCVRVKPLLEPRIRDTLRLCGGIGYTSGHRRATCCPYYSEYEYLEGAERSLPLQL